MINLKLKEFSSAIGKYLDKLNIEDSKVFLIKEGSLELYVYHQVLSRELSLYEIKIYENRKLISNLFIDCHKKFIEDKQKYEYTDSCLTEETNLKRLNRKYNIVNCSLTDKILSILENYLRLNDKE